VSRILYTPFSIAAGLLAGFAAQKLFERVWGLVGKEEVPEPEHRDVSLVELAAALMIEGAIFRAVRGLAEHGFRRGYTRFTGTWPGEEAPERD
jgi:Protein of unknown function (DUF4235)